jgi:hypothetical protein
MSDMHDAATLVTSLKTAYDLSKAFLDVRGAVSEQAKVFELQRVILAAQADALAAQTAQATQLARISELEKRVAELEAWDAEKQKYELIKLAEPGVFAYRLQPEAKGSGPVHELCANCFDQGHKSVLQREMRVPGRSLVAVCPRCEAAYYIAGPRYAEPRRRG